VPQEIERPTQATAPVECEAICTHHRPVRLSWAKLLNVTVQATRRTGPLMSAVAEDSHGRWMRPGDKG